MGTTKLKVGPDSIILNFEGVVGYDFLGSYLCGKLIER